MNPGEPGTFNSVLLPVAAQLLSYVDLTDLVLVVVIPRRNASLSMQCIRRGRPLVAVIALP